MKFRTFIELLAIVSFLIIWILFPRIKETEKIINNVDTLTVVLNDTIEKIITYKDTVIIERILIDTHLVNVYNVGYKKINRTFGFDNIIDNQYRMIHKYDVESNINVYVDSLTNDIFIKNTLSITQTQLDFRKILVKGKGSILFLGVGRSFTGDNFIDLQVGYVYLFKNFSVGATAGVNSILITCGVRF